MKKTIAYKAYNIMISILMSLCIIVGTIGIIPARNAYAAVEVVVETQDGIITVRGDAPSGEEVSITILKPGYDVSDMDMSWDAVLYSGKTTAWDDRFEMNITTNNFLSGGVYTLICSTKDASVTKTFAIYSDADKIDAIMKLNAYGPYGNVENLYSVFGLDSHELYSLVDKDVIAQILYRTPVYEENIAKMYEILQETLCIGAYSQGVPEIIKDGYLSYTDIVGIENETTYEDYLSSLTPEGVDEVNRQVLVRGFNSVFEIREEFSKTVLVNLITNNHSMGWGHVKEVFDKYDSEFQMYGLDTTKIDSLTSYQRSEVYAKLAHSGAKTFEDFVNFYHNAIKKVMNQNTSSSGGGGGGGSSLPSYDVTYEKSADGSIINVECDNVSADSFSLIIAFYRRGKLVDICVSENKSSEFTTNQPYDTEKIMVLESLQSMKPLVNSDKIKDVTDYENPNNYAYVLNAAFNDADFTSAWQMKVLTKDNEVVIYTVCSEIIADGEYISADMEECKFLEQFVSVKDINGVDADKSPHRLIRYTLDSRNRISEIYTIDGTRFHSVNYDAYERTLGDNIALCRETVVFNIASAESDDYFAENLTGLNWKDVYSGYYSANGEGVNDCLIITAVNSSVDYTQDMVIVSSVGDLDLDETEQEAKKVEYYSASSKVCKFKLDMGTNVNFDNYEPPSFNFSPVISDFELIDITDITDVEVTPVETDGGDYSGVVKNKIDTLFTIEVPDIDIDACNGFYKTN